MLPLAILAQLTKSSAKVDFVLDTTSTRSPLPHFWERCFGSPHATLALREDYRRHLKMAKQDLGAGAVRFHGILNDDMSTFISDGEYSFYNVDNIFDWLVANNMIPIIELSFMPEGLASNNTHVFHYNANTSPPKVMAAWNRLISAFTNHIVARYGLDEVSKWWIEVWNEPDIVFWSGTQAQYFDLYANTARTIKAVSPRIRVGGPSSSCCARWIEDFVNFINKNNVPCDFLTAHQYGGDGAHYGSVKDLVDAFSISAKFAAQQKIPLIITEWGNTYEHFVPILDEPATAAFIFATLDAIHTKVNPEVFSYWTFTDIFEEAGFPTRNLTFHGGFGLINLYDVPKPAYRAFQILKTAGDERFPFSSRSDVDCNTVGLLPVYNRDRSSITLVIYNHNTGGSPISECSVNINLVSVKDPAKTAKASVMRIDQTHTNPKAEWERLGAPSYPTREQIQRIDQASQLDVQSYSLSSSGSSVYGTFSLPPHSSLIITTTI